MALLVFIVFSSLVALTWGRSALARRTGAEWLLDGSGLVMQGVVVPLCQTLGLYLVLEKLVPAWKGVLDVPGPVAFLLNFVAVDYLYYWNHRLLHGAALWDWHALHHTAGRLDVLVTSRNTLWSHFLIVYVWVNALSVFLLKEPVYFLLSAALTAGLDLWRHSEIYPKEGNVFYDWLSRVLMTPQDHAWHHSREKLHGNFGANLKIWDQLHGTYLEEKAYPARLGIALELSPLRKLLYPLGRQP